ncbi:hypothetical protein O9H85_13535 [Paenibacillus filicis]|uniref:Acetyl-CoA acetyltransferase n=1 Tax=Paenibacillus gyeongsangnamensis TaxID=3388067 RepID=A0ABT4Q9D2_9BACL|nr:hypothetical protein [Paenibacillus filicis]MCZ8513433.1 hypothetical protein [Paenibacillus filicis]
MSSTPYSGQPQMIYQLESEHADLFHKCRERIHTVCIEHLHKRVRIQTVHGQTHDGILVHIDSYHIYLQMMPGYSRALMPYGYGYGYSPYSSNVILPLVLFDLLTIALIV